jgi:Uncharacterized conserved protein
MRILGVDDGPFTFNDRSVLVVGVVVRGVNYIEGIIKKSVKRDGFDSTDVLIEMVDNSRYKEQIRVIMTDGIALAGFNVIDIGRLYKTTGKAVISITRDKPDERMVEEALKNHFKDWKKRVKMIEEYPLIEVKTVYKPIFVKSVGVDENETKTIIKHAIVRGRLPEPIRLAHLIASAYVKGESYGRA